MKVVFLGVGEAFDENHADNSHLILSDKTVLMLDCGDSAVRQLWKYNNDKDFLDGVYITHLHADHYFGLSALFVRMWEEKRTKDFTVIVQKGGKKIIEDVLELAYPGFKNWFEYKIIFIEVLESDKISFNELKLSFASTLHSGKNFAIKVSDGEKRVCYSGDGMFNEETEKLYFDSDLVIHESYLYNEKRVGHASIKDLIEMVKKNNIKCLALTHLNRNFRKNELLKVKPLILKENLNVIIPEELEEYDLEKS